MLSSTRLLLLLALGTGVLMSGCLAAGDDDDASSDDDDATADDDDATADDDDATADDDDATADDDDATGDDDDATGSAWAAQTSPCTGSGMNALVCDDPATCYAGCGENAVGEGLHLTADGGATWAAPTDEAGGAFGAFRVMHLLRDGSTLYVSGTATSQSFRVVALDTDSGGLTQVYNNINNVDFAMTAGSYARTPGGLEIAESLTGSSIVIRSTDATWLDTHQDTDGWASGYGWWLNTDFTGNVQIQDMVTVDGQILGVGAQINQPPTVYLPPRTWDFATDSSGDDYIDQLWESVGLAGDFTAYDGECWHIDGNDDGLAVVCVNQDANVGMVYTIGSDWATTGYDRANWTVTNVSDVVAAGVVLGNATWNEGVCRGPNNDVTVVGRDSQRDVGYALRSTDGGATWTEITAGIEEANAGQTGPLTRCVYVDGHLVIGGAGILAVADLSDL